MGVILDTTVLIGAEKRTFDLEAFLESRSDDTVGIAAITASELLHGVERATDKGKRSRRGDLVEGLLDAFPTFAFGLEEARIHARIWAALATRGKMIGAHDLIISATAIARGSEVAKIGRASCRERV